MGTSSEADRPLAATGQALESMRFHLGSLELDVPLRRLSRGECVIPLRPRAFEMLVYLVTSRTRVVTKQELIRALWKGTKVVENAVPQCVTALRKALVGSGVTIENSYGRGYKLCGDVTPIVEIACGAATERPAQAAPAIAVLPFEGDPTCTDASHLAEGISDDLIRRLAAWRCFPVIARSSSFALRAHRSDPRRVGLELGARYIVDGHARRLGDRLRVEVYVVDARTGLEVWSERHDGTFENVATLQDDVADAIASAVYPQLFDVERVRTQSQRREDPDVWDLLFVGIWHLERLDAKDNATARHYFERALARDPGFLPALDRLGTTHYNDLIYRWATDPAGSLHALQVVAEQCLRVSARAPSGHALKGLAEWAMGRGESAVASLQLALELNPNDVTTHSTLGQYLALRLRPIEGARHLETAIHLSPRDPRTFHFYFGLGLVAFVQAQYEQAIDWATRSLRLNPDLMLNRLLIASACGHLGRRCEAQAHARALRAQASGSVVGPLDLLEAAAPEPVERFVRGLERADLAMAGLL